MHSLSRITSFILTALLIVIMTAAQLLYCLHSTAISSQHASRLLENGQKLSQLTNSLYDGLAASSNAEEQDGISNQYAAKILAGTDQSWVRSQLYITLKGVHQYLFSNASTLPTIDIIPLKKAIRSVLVSEIMKSDEAVQNQQKIQTILSALNNKYFARIIALGLDNQLVSMLLELSPIRGTGFDRTTVQEVIRIYLSLSNQSITLDQASASIAEQITADTLRLNEIKDYFDLSLFMEKAFGELNPLKTCKVFIADIDKTVSRAVNVSLWCVILLLLISNRFRLRSIIKAAAFGMLAASVIVLCISLLIMNKALMDGLLAHAFIGNNPLSYMTASFTSLLIRDYGLYLSLQALAAGLPCIALLFLTFRVKPADKKEKGHRLFPFVRLSLGITGLLLVFVAISFISVCNEYNTFKTSLAKLSQTDISQSVKNGLIEAGGMEFLKIIEKIK